MKTLTEPFEFQLNFATSNKYHHLFGKISPSAEMK
jgi:hypothetical protein